MKSTITYETLKRLIRESEDTDGIIDRIKTALESIPGAEFSKIIEQRAKTIVNVNSANPLKARALMSRPEFANACQAQVTPLRKTISNGISLYVEDPAYGKPIIIRIRKGGNLARGIGNEATLVSIIDNAIQSGASSIIFKDDKNGSIIVKNPTAVRGVGNEAGSRMGNRADIEITDENGTAHRISVKKDNFSAIAKLKRFFASRRLKIQRSLRDFAAATNMEFPRKGLIAVPVKNASLFKFCWFGNDIDENGGVVEGNFEKDGLVTADEAKNAVIIKCTRAFSSKDNINKLMTDASTSAWLIGRVNKYWHLEIIGVFNSGMSKNYILPNFEIDGVTNNQLTEDWNKIIESILAEEKQAQLT